MRSFNKKSVYAVILGLILGFFLIGTVLNIIFPSQFNEVRQRFQMWKVGAHSIVPTDAIKGLELNRCGPGQTSVQTRENCVCVVLIHGLGDQLSTWRKIFLADEKLWNTQYRLLAIDLPGFGGSPAPKDTSSYSVNQTVEALSKFLSERELCKKNLIVGNSFGGWVAMKLAIKHPTQVSQLVLIGANGLKPTPDEITIDKNLLENPTVDSLKEFQRRAYFKPREYPDRFWRLAFARIKSSNTKAVIQAQTEADYLDEEISMLKTPVLYLRGEADQIVTEAQTKKLLVKIPGTKLETLPECGHLPQKECPERLIPILNQEISLTLQTP